MSVGGHTEQKRRLLFQTSSLPGTLDPSVPDELIWYSHEPTWQQVARGRIKYGMKDFSLRLQYEDDFGVNANLAVKAKNANLDFGGEFKNHESTIWNIHGKWKE